MSSFKRFYLWGMTAKLYMGIYIAAIVFVTGLITAIYGGTSLRLVVLLEMFAVSIAAGFSQEQVEGYLQQAGPFEITRTHGRREMAFLNRAWENVLALDLCLDTDHQAQLLLDHAVNTRPSRCVGYEGLGLGLERMALILTQ